jgi:hypothetical protein
MEASAMVLTGVILIFVLVSGLVILLRRGAELDAWGSFVAHVLRGDRRRIEDKTSSDPKKHTSD